jgi:hypothetical protein
MSIITAICVFSFLYKRPDGQLIATRIFLFSDLWWLKDYWKIHPNDPTLCWKIKFSFTCYGTNSSRKRVERPLSAFPPPPLPPQPTEDGTPDQDVMKLIFIATRVTLCWKIEMRVQFQVYYGNWEDLPSLYCDHTSNHLSLPNRSSQTNNCYGWPV